MIVTIPPIQIIKIYKCEIKYGVNNSSAIVDTLPILFERLYFDCDNQKSTLLKALSKDF